MPPTSKSLAKKVICSQISTETVITDFGSITIIDSGAAGFRLKDEDGNIIIIPTGVPVNIGGPGPMLCSQITIMAPESGSLNAAVLYYK
jgi:hypothetical protein